MPEYMPDITSLFNIKRLALAQCTIYFRNNTNHILLFFRYYSGNGGRVTFKRICFSIKEVSCELNAASNLEKRDYKERKGREFY